MNEHINKVILREALKELLHGLVTNGQPIDVAYPICGNVYTTLKGYFLSKSDARNLVRELGCGFSYLGYHDVYPLDTKSGTTFDSGAYLVEFLWVREYYIVRTLLVALLIDTIDEWWHDE